MAKVQNNFLLVKNIKDNGKIIRCTERVFIIIWMALNTTVSGKIILNKGRVCINMLIMLLSMGFGKKIKKVDMGYIVILMETSMPVAGKKI